MRVKLKTLTAWLIGIVILNAIIIVSLSVKKIELKNLGAMRQSVSNNINILSEKVGAFSNLSQEITYISNDNSFWDDEGIFISHKTIPSLDLIFRNAACKGEIKLNNIKWWTFKKEALNDPDWSNYLAVTSAWVTYKKCNDQLDSYKLTSYLSYDGGVVTTFDDIDDKDRIYIHAIPKVRKASRGKRYLVIAFEQDDTGAIIGEVPVYYER
jgi:hypothetical protein